MIFCPLYLKDCHIQIISPPPDLQVCKHNTFWMQQFGQCKMEPRGIWWVGWVWWPPSTTHSPPTTPIVFPRGQVGRRVPADFGNQVWGAQINTDTLILHCDARWLMCDTLTISVHCNSRVIAGCDGHLVANTHWCSGPGRWKHLNANCCCETLNKG